MGSLNIFSTLSIARQGMMASQAGLGVTSQNVANVNTEGYSRRAVTQGSVAGPPLGGGGVQITGVKRFTDTFAHMRLVSEQSLIGNSQERARILSQVSVVFNDLEDTGIGGALDNFFGSLRQIEANPSDVTARMEVISRGQELAITFNRASDQLLAIRSGIDSTLRSSVIEVNALSEKLAALNADILSATVRGQDLSDHYDHRDQLVREISQHVSVSFVVNDKDQLTLFMEGGSPLVEGDSFSTLRVPDTAAPGMSVVEYVTPAGVASDVTGKLTGGVLGAAIHVRDVQIPSYEASLDQLAYDLADAINGVHQSGYGLDGVGGRSFFAPLASADGAAGAIALDPAISGDPKAIAAAEDPLMVPGDNRNAIALAGLADLPLSAGGTTTFNQTYAALVGNVGIDARRANEETATRESTILSVEGIRESVAGVSLDEEMANLIMYQRAYQASSRVLAVVDEALDSLLRMR